MAYKPTRQAQTRIQPLNAPRSNPAFKKAEALDSVSQSLGAFSQGLMKRTYEAEQNADVANALMLAPNVINKDGSINPEAAKDAKKIWSSEGNRRYQANTIALLSAASEGHISDFVDQYLQANPFGADASARKRLETDLDGIRSTLDPYGQIVLADFDLRKARALKTVDFKTSAAVQKRTLENELSSAVSLAQQSIVKIQQIGRDEKWDPEAFDETFSDFKTAISAISDTPLQIESGQRSAQIRRLQNEFHTAAASGILIGQAIADANISLRINIDNFYGVKKAFNQIANSVESDPDFLLNITRGYKAIAQSKEDGSFEFLGNAQNVASAIRSARDVYLAEKQAKNTELYRQAEERNNQFQYENITNQDELGIREILQNPDYLVTVAQENGSKDAYATALAWHSNARQRLNDINAQNSQAFEEDRKRINLLLQPHLSILNNGSLNPDPIAKSLEEGDALLQVTLLMNQNPTVRDHASILKAIAKGRTAAFKRDTLRDTQKLDFLMAQIKANGFGNPDNTQLFVDGDDLVDRIGDDGFKAKWLDFTSSKAQYEELSLIHI